MIFYFSGFSLSLSLSSHMYIIQHISLSPYLCTTSLHIRIDGYITFQTLLLYASREGWLNSRACNIFLETRNRNVFINLINYLIN